jgi:hypothetical protein
LLVCFLVPILDDHLKFNPHHPSTGGKGKFMYRLETNRKPKTAMLIAFQMIATWTLYPSLILSWLYLRTG